MLHFPTTGIDLEKLHSFIKPVEKDGSIDSFQYGINTRIVHRDNVEFANRILDLETDRQIDYDVFWEGFYYGIESVIAACTIQ